MISINKKGVIISGKKHIGWNIFVEPIKEGAGGYLILYTHENEGYDDWVENQKTLEQLFDYNGFEVEWEK